MKKCKIILGVIIIMAAFVRCSDLPNDNNSGDEDKFPKGYQVEVRDSDGFNFLLFLPENESEMIDGKYPTILFLHGIGERGNDLQILRREGLPKILDGDKSFPFIVISPQCPVSTEWYYKNENNVGALERMLDDAVSRFPIDTNRIYITGLSMGGIATWYFAINMPDRFAAMAPVAFRGDGWSPYPARNIPAWGFHGAEDGVIPLYAAKNLVEQFKQCGGNIEFTIFNGLSHDCWTRTYNKPELYSWFLTHSK